MRGVSGKICKRRDARTRLVFSREFKERKRGRSAYKKQGKYGDYETIDSEICLVAKIRRRERGWRGASHEGGS